MDEPSLEEALDRTSVNVPAPAPPAGPPRGHARVQDEDYASRSSEPDPEDPKLARLIADVRDYQLTHGSLLKLVRYVTPTQTSAASVNVSLYPTPFPGKFYRGAVALQHSMNQLYVRVANDEDWLYSVLGPQIQGDPEGLTSSLWDVHVKCREAGVVQDVGCGVFRSDYMLHAEDEEAALSGGGMITLKQVEMNHLSVAGAYHADNVAGMHRYLLQKRIAERTEDPMELRRLLPNTNTASLVTGLTRAHRVYREQESPHDREGPSCILMVVQPFNFNIADERPIEHGLWDEDVPCYRCEWRSVLMQCRLADGERKLYFRPEGSGTEFEVSVTYYRAGYDPREYADNNGRETRVLLEMSRAIKCPDILTHLATFKSVQQALAEPDVAEGFLAGHTTEQQQSAVRGTFMHILPLDTSPAGMEARRIAADLELSDAYVLKPNLEGGGHNIYRDDIPGFLANVGEERWHEYILMKMITPPTSTAGMLLTAEEGLYHGDVVSELGVLGFVMWKRPRGSAGKICGKGKDVRPDVEILENETVGWTFKTKPRDVDDMSVVKGYGCFDCPLLS
ncbi:Uu.00g060600.m01.CDS01 [Anthostomella pinea]|uniref:Glutathione synthetase n=1 Tax=Anthostomella pinea TaxID=933095 RepID=A0AAI8YML1_9PEZI|nr:Uu.00g060600.m01.CDS01 [Anthostomella pinea]